MSHRAATHTNASLRVIFVRHGESVANRDFVRQEGLVSGPSTSLQKQKQKQPGLTEIGEQQAKDVARALKDVQVHQIISSPLVRAQCTAGPLCEDRSMPLTIDPAWVEFDETCEDVETFKRRATYLWSSLILRAKGVAAASAATAIATASTKASATASTKASTKASATASATASRSDTETAETTTASVDTNTKYGACETIVLVTHSLLLSTLLGSTLKPSMPFLQSMLSAHTVAAWTAEHPVSVSDLYSERTIEFQTQVHFPNASISVVDFEATGVAHIVMLGYTSHLRTLSGPHPMVKALSIATSNLWKSLQNEHEPIESEHHGSHPSPLGLAQSNPSLYSIS